MIVRFLGVVVVLAGFAAMPPGLAAAEPGSAAAADILNGMYSGPGVVFRGPENCVDITEGNDPFDNPDVVDFCAVKDVVGALGGPSSGAPATDFVQSPNRFEFSQPVDCPTVGPVADGVHDGCAVVTGAVTLLRAGVPVRLFGVCAKAEAADCAVLGTITDPNWTPDGVYMLMDPARVAVHCQYAQDAGRNGCDAGGLYTAGQWRPMCSAEPTNSECEFGPAEQGAMLAAYTGYCTDHADTCLENQIEAQWDPQSVVAVGYLNRADQAFDCPAAHRKAKLFTDAVNRKWGTALAVVQIRLDVASDTIAFADDATGCAPAA